MRTVVERRLALLFRALATAFALVGAVFLVWPDPTIEFMNRIGTVLAMPEAPAMTHRFWLSLGTAYMATVTALAWMIANNPLGRRSMMLALAVGKATSSLTCLWFFLGYERYFVYLANFVVDGSLVAIVLGAWVVAGRAGGGASEPATIVGGRASPQDKGAGVSADAQARAEKILSVLLPIESDDTEEVRTLVRQMSAYFVALPHGPLAFRLLLAYLDWLPVIRCKSTRRLSRMSYAERSAALASVESSSFLLVRAPLHALKLLAYLHYYEDGGRQCLLGANPSYGAEKLALAARRRADGQTPRLPKPTTYRGLWVN